MTTVQRFFTAILPARWARSMREESEAWHVTCRTCGSSRSVLEAGGIRWGAASRGKRSLTWCSRCGRLRVVSYEKRS